MVLENDIYQGRDVQNMPTDLRMPYLDHASGAEP